MLRQLLYLNIAILALSSTISLVLTVVCLLYWIYADSEPTLRADFPALLVATTWFIVLASVAALATWRMRYNDMTRWIGQGAVVLVLASLVVVVPNVLT